MRTISEMVNEKFQIVFVNKSIAQIPKVSFKALGKY